MYKGECKYNIPNTKFDIINSPSYWTEKWEDLPKICKVDIDNTPVTNQIVLFYWNEKDTDVKVECNITNSQGEIIYTKDIVLSPKAWIVDNVPLKEQLYIENINTRENNSRKATFTFSPDTITKTPIKFRYGARN